MADPMYRQIAEVLRLRIEAGELVPGAQLPTEIDLRDRYAVSRGTVREAVKWLIARGLVETRPGQGTFVIEKITPFVITLSGDPETGFGGGEDDVYGLDVKATWWEPAASRPRVEVHRASEVSVPELQLGEDSIVVSRHQRRFIDGTPWSLQTSFYPMRYIEQGASRLTEPGDIAQGTVSYLHETLGIDQAGWRDIIAVRGADEVETSFFKLPDDGRVPIIETRRTVFDSDGMPIRLTVSVYPADRNRFAVNAGRVPDQVIFPAE
ncbi:MAG: GntR family transcriptional regulator [Streptosporangiaceae bacterium]